MISFLFPGTSGILEAVLCSSADSGVGFGFPPIERKREPNVEPSGMYV